MKSPAIEQEDCGHIGEVDAGRGLGCRPHRAPDEGTEARQDPRTDSRCYEI